LSPEFLPSEREEEFPKLRAEGYRVTSEETVIYNCVAWAARWDKTRWWQAGTEPGFFWPPGVLDDGSFQSYVQLFRQEGFRECTNQRLELLREKVALFATPDGEFSHVSRQLASGAWSSKLGGWEDIRHETLSGLEPFYGTVKLIMRRPAGFIGFLTRLFHFASFRIFRRGRTRAGGIGPVNVPRWTAHQFSGKAFCGGSKIELRPVLGRALGSERPSAAALDISYQRT
jgi:hypothetical protein